MANYLNFCLEVNVIEMYLICFPYKDIFLVLRNCSPKPCSASSALRCKLFKVYKVPWMFL